MGIFLSPFFSFFWVCGVGGEGMFKWGWHHLLDVLDVIVIVFYKFPPRWLLEKMNASVEKERPKASLYMDVASCAIFLVAQIIILL